MKLEKKHQPYIAALTALLIIVVMSAWSIMPVSSDRTPVRVVIPKGASASEVARVLGDNNIIRSPFLFSLKCRFSGKAGDLKTGMYQLNRAMSISEIIDTLVKGDAIESWVTMPEGFTARQIGNVLIKKGLVDGDSFVRCAINDGGRFAKYTFVTGNNLEGYLFPDTYLIAKNTDTSSIIDKMLSTFEGKVIDPSRADIVRVNQTRFGLGENAFPKGLQRIITMASLVEREAKVPKDRPLIAAVLWNRLAKRMRLEVDATVSYVPGESTDNKDRVLYSDLRCDSAYNTYKHFGLPPAPICNPGLASIKAVLSPAKVDYLFYVAKPDGSHVFSRTYKEHLTARHAIRQGYR